MIGSGERLTIRNRACVNNTTVCNEIEDWRDNSLRIRETWFLK